MFKKTIIPVIFLCGLFSNIRAQCNGYGPADPSLGLNNISIGTIPWANTVNIYSSNNSKATASPIILGDKTYYLCAMEFGFSVPVSAVICGITVQIEKSASGSFQNVTDNSVKIVKAGIVCGTEHALTGTWPGTDTYYSYGGPADLWGNIWTPSDINSANFGVAVSANLSGSSALPTAYFDHVKIIIDYNIFLPVELLNFNAEFRNEEVILSWKTASESNNDFYSIERTHNGNEYETIGRVNGAGNSNQIQSYNFIDSEPLPGFSYYRLKQTDLDGRFEYFKIVAVEQKKLQVLVVSPNPAIENISVSFNYSKNENYTLTLYDIYGQAVLSVCNITTGNIEIKRDNLLTGLYFVKLKTNNGDLETAKFLLK